MTAPRLSRKTHDELLDVLSRLRIATNDLEDSCWQMEHHGIAEVPVKYVTTYERSLEVVEQFVQSARRAVARAIPTRALPAQTAKEANGSREARRPVKAKA